MLQVQDLNVFYGGIHALRNISLTVNEQEIVSIVGANGAGKSTLLKSIAGVIKPASGKVIFRNEEMRLTPQKIVAKGISLVPEGRRIFANLSVLDNLLVGGYLRSQAEVKESMEQVLELFPKLQERLKQAGGTLSGGEQQMLAVGRALMSKPRLLMLDEPTLGLAPVIVDILFDGLERVRQLGITLLLVEQNAMMAIELADRAYIIQTGQIVKEDRAAALLEDEQIVRSYLGGATKEGTL